MYPPPGHPRRGAGTLATVAAQLRWAATLVAEGPCRPVKRDAAAGCWSAAAASVSQRPPCQWCSGASPHPARRPRQTARRRSSRGRKQTPQQPARHRRAPRLNAPMGNPPPAPCSNDSGCGSRAPLDPPPCPPAQSDPQPACRPSNRRPQHAQTACAAVPSLPAHPEKRRARGRGGRPPSCSPPLTGDGRAPTAQSASTRRRASTVERMD